MIDIRASITGLGVLLILFFLILPDRSATAQESAQLLFDKANDALEEGDLRQALESYRKIEQHDVVSGALYLNMAISYSETDSLGMAKYYFLKASRFNETADRAREGLEYVESQFSRQSAVLPKLPWEKAVDWLKINMGAATLLGISILSLNLGVILYILTWFVRLPFEKWIDITGITLAGLGLILMGLSFYVEYVDKRYSQAVMVHKQANLFEQPSPDAPVISQAYEGYGFTVDEFKSREQTRWSYVRMSNGFYGWIQSSEILIL